jgi:hypothetical protein
VSDLVARPALAWGPDGHAIVADIAEAHLTPAARSQVAALLATAGGHHLADVASWADEIRHDHPLTGAWHFVNIPLGAGGFNHDRDCAGDNCVVAAIGRFEAVLADQRRPPADRLVALEWVVHFVGDIHQPLHASDNNDKGGNDLTVTYFGKLTNLHAIWDETILDKATGLHVGPHFSVDQSAALRVALKLDSGISSVERSSWAPAGLAASVGPAAVAWANDSHALARDAYASLQDRGRAGWDASYQSRSWPVVSGQLQRAGVRLAELLNETL